jgi:hypothetical protein
MDAGLWTPHAHSGARLPYYSPPVPPGEADDSAAISVSMEVERLVECAGPADLSGLAPSFAPDEAEARVAAYTAAAGIISNPRKPVFCFGSLAALGRVVLNPSDPDFTFEVLPAAPEATQEQLAASGMHLLPPPKPTQAPKGASNLASADDPVVQEFQHFNISNDAGMAPALLAMLTLDI